MQDERKLLLKEIMLRDHFNSVWSQGSDEASVW